MTTFEGCGGGVVLTVLVLVLVLAAGCATLLQLVGGRGPGGVLACPTSQTSKEDRIKAGFGGSSTVSSPGSASAPQAGGKGAGVPVSARSGRSVEFGSRRGNETGRRSAMGGVDLRRSGRFSEIRPDLLLSSSGQHGETRIREFMLPPLAMPPTPGNRHRDQQHDSHGQAGWPFRTVRRGSARRPQPGPPCWTTRRAHRPVRHPPGRSLIVIRTGIPQRARGTSDKGAAAGPACGRGFAAGHRPAERSDVCCCWRLQAVTVRSPGHVATVDQGSASVISAL